MIEVEFVDLAHKTAKTISCLQDRVQILLAAKRGQKDDKTQSTGADTEGAMMGEEFPDGFTAWGIIKGRVHTEARIARLLRTGGSRIKNYGCVRRFFLRLFRLENKWLKTGFISNKNMRCPVECICGNLFPVSDCWITWCNQCGRGYSAEFKCYRYPARLKGR